MTHRAGLPWDDADDMRIRLAYGKAPHAVIAKQIGRSTMSVGRRIWELELHVTPKRPSRARYVQILTDECKKAGIALAPALNNHRKRIFAHARFRAWARLREQNFSLPGIGICARVDHSTVHNGLKRAAEMGRPA